MTSYLRIRIIMILVGCIATLDAYAQSTSIKSTSIVDDVTTMEKLEQLLPSSDRNLSAGLQLNHGPLQYRLSTAQGALFQATQKPFIIFPNSDDGLSDRILNGLTVTAGELPWQVALLNSTYGTLFCSGSHIGNGWIVTAAHCVKDELGSPLKQKDIIVLVGSVSLIAGGNRLPLSRDPIFHEAYDPSTKANDIALLKISNHTSLPSILLPIPLVEAPLVVEDTILTVSGWGKTTENGKISTELLKVDVPVVSHEKCTVKYPSVNENLQVCAGKPETDSCQGDSGGPLTGIDENGRVLIGVVSFGKGCGRAGFPGVYTRVVPYTKWINDKSGNLAI